MAEIWGKPTYWISQTINYKPMQEYARRIKNKKLLTFLIKRSILTVVHEYKKSGPRCTSLDLFITPYTEGIYTMVIT